MNLTKLLELFEFKIDTDYHPRTFKEELNRLCNMITLPTAILAILAWPIFIFIDKDLFGDFPIIVYFRWGFTLVGIIVFTLQMIPYFKKRGYWLVNSIIYYAGIATAIIVAIVGGHPSYMGGFSLVILTCSLVPLQRVHALFHLMFTLLCFLVTSTLWEVHFTFAAETYGLVNLVLAIYISILSIFVFDRIRETSYRKSLLLKIANEDLHKANELKNQLLEIAAHDLKDPLQVIIGYTDMLQIKLRNDTFAGDKLKIIYRSTDRMIKLIAGLLEITSIESGKVEMHPTPVNFSEIVEAAITRYQKTSEKKNQTMHFSTDEHCTIYGDKMLLRQIVNHLIDNAVKFSPPGKSIWISIACSERDTVLFKVIDEGPGLQEHELEKIFEKFQQLSTKPTGGEISTGLGLAITKDLVKLHKGNISVQSKPGQGAAFTVEFPRYTDLTPYSAISKD